MATLVTRGGVTRLARRPEHTCVGVWSTGNFPQGYVADYAGTKDWYSAGERFEWQPVAGVDGRRVGDLQGRVGETAIGGQTIGDYVLHLGRALGQGRFVWGKILSFDDTTAELELDTKECPNVSLWAIAGCGCDLIHALAQAVNPHRPEAQLKPSFGNIPWLLAAVQDGLWLAEHPGHNP